MNSHQESLKDNVMSKFGEALASLECPDEHIIQKPKCCTRTKKRPKSSGKLSVKTIINIINILDIVHQNSKIYIQPDRHFNRIANTPWSSWYG